MNIRRIRSDSSPGRGISLAWTVRCARFVYNYMLRLCSDTWYRQQTRIGYPETVDALIVLKGMSQYGFLTEATPGSLDEALHDLDADFSEFRSGEAPYPRFRGMEPPDREIAESREYPTANRCYDCGYFLEQIPREDEWTCPDCGVVHDTQANIERNAEAIRRAFTANNQGAILPPE